ncbi:hypothetical protein K2X05_08705, partial [bacterium]|nr:hypothetical protein [bacterium]
QIILNELVASAGSESVTIRVRDDVTASYVLTLPDDDGSAGQVLSTNGSGVLSWVASSGGSGDIINGGNSTAATVVIGTNDANDLVLEANNSERARFYSNGRILFGGSSGMYGGGKKFDYFDNNWSTPGDFATINQDTYMNGNANTGTAVGIRNWMRSNAPNDHNNVYAAHNIVTHWGTGNIASGIASYNEFGNNGAIATAGVGSYNVVDGGGGTITSAYAIRAQITGAGTKTNSYGLHIDALTGTNRWGVYQNGSADNNYFAGNVGIGTTTPGTALDVLGAITSRPNGTGTGQTGQLIMRELAASPGGTDTVTIRAPDSVGTSFALTLPDTAGS